MQSAELQIITDSTADLSKEVVIENNIDIIPAVITFGDKSFLDGIDLTTHDFIQLLKTSPHHPMTAAPGPNMFLERLSDEASGVSIHVGGKFSRFVQSAQEAIREKDPEGTRFSVVDSGTTSCALGFLVMEAIRMRNQGKTKREILSALERLKKLVTVVVAVEDLEYPKRGGRISNLTSEIGSILKIKPILEIRNNVISSLERPRTWGKALKRMEELVKERMPLEKLSIIYCEAKSDAQELADKARAFFKGPISLVQTGPALGAQGSPGLVAFACVSKE